MSFRKGDPERRQYGYSWWRKFWANTARRQQQRDVLDAELAEALDERASGEQVRSYESPAEYFARTKHLHGLALLLLGQTSWRDPALEERAWEEFSERLGDPDLAARIRERACATTPRTEVTVVMRELLDTSQITTAQAEPILGPDGEW